MQFVGGIVYCRSAHSAHTDAVPQCSTQSGMLKNRTSARVSIPPQLKFNTNTGVFEWRTDLLKSQPHWRGWYTGTAVYMPLCVFVLKFPPLMQAGTKA